MATRPSTPLPSESVEQATVIDWAQAMRHRFPDLTLLYASQAGARVSWKQAKRLKAEGMQPGVPDLHLPIARGGYHGLWIEMKRRRRAVLSARQRWWHDRLALEGHRVCVCKGAEHAIAVLFAYLSLPRAQRISGPGGTADPSLPPRCVARDAAPLL